MKVRLFKFFAALGIASSFALAATFPQVPNQSRQLRIQIWSELDPFPGGFGDEAWETEEKDDVPSAKTDAALPSAGGSAENEAMRTRLYSFAIGRAKELTPFFLSGMLSGWTFDYTPADKARGVEEYFEFGEIHPFDWSVNSIEYRDPVPEDDL